MAQDTKSKDLVELLLQDHREVEVMLGELDSPSVDAGQLFCRAVHTLVGHEVAEEEVVYPAVRRMVDGGDALADARIAEQQKAEETLYEMERMDATSAEFRTRFQELKKAVLEHAKTEEREVFPKLTAAADVDELKKLGTVYEAAKAMAPTHPHPHAPNTPPGNLLMGPVAAIADRFRDAARGAMAKARG